MTRKTLTLIACLAVAGLFLADLPAAAQAPHVVTSANRPLASLRTAGAQMPLPPMRPGLREIPNFRGTPQGPNFGPDTLRQASFGFGPTEVSKAWEGADNEDNLSTVGFRVAPPDTDGTIGYHNGQRRFLQMINLITTVFDENGTVVDGPMATNAIWAGAGGLCEAWNQGDPITLYDENPADPRWIVSQFAFDDNFTVFAQCIAVSMTDDPTGAYNRYEFSFNSLGLNDYPKHGIVTESITMIANLFTPPFFSFGGTFIGAMDKAAMYAGGTGTLVGFNLGSAQFGFLPVDLDDPTGNASFTSALFGTAMSRRRRFDIWEIDVDWNNPNGATRSRIDDVRISAYDSDLCGASREACIPQPSGGPALEAISDRLMHRLQMRDFGTHKSMMAAHTIDADGNGTAGIRWYEFRQNPNNGNFTKEQEGTYAPNDGLSRWMPSIAMNAAGDVGMGFLVSSTSEPMGTRVVTQTAGTGGGVFDGTEEICRAGEDEQTGTARSGDYSSTSVDPVSDTFWHTNEYGQNIGKTAGWGTYVCEFGQAAPTCTDNDMDGYGDPGSSQCTFPQEDCDDGDSTVNPGATEGPVGDVTCTDGKDNECDGLTDAADPDCQECANVGESCLGDADCCSGNCSKGKPATRVCQ